MNRITKLGLEKLAEIDNDNKERYIPMAPAALGAGALTGSALTLHERYSMKPIMKQNREIGESSIRNLNILKNYPETPAVKAMKKLNEATLDKVTKDHNRYHDVLPDRMKKLNLGGGGALGAGLGYYTGKKYDDKQEGKKGRVLGAVGGTVAGIGIGHLLNKGVDHLG